MPDISMCENITCPLKSTCYRFTAVPNDYQTYGSFEPIVDKETSKVYCDYYWKDYNTNAEGDE